MVDDRLNLRAGFKDDASAGVRKLGKALGGIKPSRGMDAANAWMKGFRKEADEAIRAARPVSSVLGGIGVSGLAAGFSLREIVKQARELADSTLQMKELGRQSSMTADQIRQLQYAAGKLHVDPSAMSGAIGSWSSKMVEFKRHLPGIYTDLMRQNADVARKIEPDSPVDALKDSLRFLSQIKDPQIQKRWADDFGLGDLVPMLSKGASGLNEAFAEAGREVKPLTKDMVDAAERLNDATNKLDTTWGNFKNEFGPIVVNGVSGAVDQFRSVLKDIEAAHDRYSGHPERVGEDETKNEEAIVGNFKKHWQEVFRGDRPILPNPFDSRSWHLPNPNDGLFDYTKGGDGEAPSGIGFSNTYTTRFGEDGNALHRNDEMPAARPSASDKWKTPARYEAEARARALGLPAGHDLKEEVREGSKQGIIQGLREMAQQQELNGAGARSGSFGGAAAGRGGSAGMPNLRYGRPKAGGQYRHGPGADGGGGPEGAFNPRQPEKPGTYRPEYKLSDADLSDYVVNTVNGEATSSAESIDAVINNMMNRVGSKGWGPSANLRDVASAPGQYAGHRPASAQVAERIRARIRAIASGGVPDNTNGSNAYRAAWYHGKWYQQHAGDGRVVGGNRFAYEPWTKNGPYAPYPAAHAQAPVPAGTPAAAVTDAEVFAARQRLMAGGHDPKDIALRDRYLKEQNTPKGHAAGGLIQGRGTGTSDSIPAWLSHGEYVVRASEARKWGSLLHAINGGHLPGFADGGPVGFGVDKQFYPKSTPGISAAEGHANRQFWRSWLRRPNAAGGMGASWRTTLGTMAMLAGESGFGLNSKTYGWDVNGPSGGVEQWHDVTIGKYAGKLHRLSDLMTSAMGQHADWKDPLVQAAFKKREDTTSFAAPWRRMLAAKTARGALKEGIDHVEIPANKDLELLRRMPNIIKLQREAVADGAVTRHEIDPVELNIRHHPHTGHPIITARAGKGVKLGIRSGPTMRAS